MKNVDALNSLRLLVDLQRAVVGWRERERERERERVRERDEREEGSIRER